MSNRIHVDYELRSRLDDDLSNLDGSEPAYYISIYDDYTEESIYIGNKKRMEAFIEAFNHDHLLFALSMMCCLGNEDTRDMVYLGDDRGINLNGDWKNPNEVSRLYKFISDNPEDIDRKISCAREKLTA